jgi:ArsR family transcriptional regulator, arsenate/arsenite/antimonite-responsive transcriptional repressor
MQTVTARRARGARRPDARPVSVEAPASAEVLAAVAKALGHPARIHIVRLLLEKRSCIGCDIVDEVGLAQSTVSEHLRILKAAGIITGEIERPRVCYSLNPESLRPLAGLLNAVFDTGDGAPACHPTAPGKRNA